MTAIPQGDRQTFLVLLAEAFAPMTGLLTTFTVIGGLLALVVTRVDAPRQTVTIGCHYNQDGAWWLYNILTGKLIRPANDLSAAAHQIRNDMERESAA
ncbi:hypothetical protein AGRA3207_000203 [Actinomadura graeca]|uniref:Uncharacterized protein n=1 Tax=Actinomadura graeca TaxID=2750812 RepID=A0ABX8QLU9_9ACTN|nr:hypothetical protein [Actinomadura graeca]QXJ19640.1 hypothetical protein AGRA3207_000203 [Actinomadura graeca]